MCQASSMRIITLAVLLGIVTQLPASKTHSGLKDGNVKVSLDLYKMVSNKQEDVLVSPLSIEMVLMLALLGARGGTEKQIAATLSLSNDWRRDVDMIATSVKALENKKDFHLKIANNLYVERNFPIKEEFKSQAKTSLFAEPDSLDFSGHIEAARNKINLWVKNKTDNIIQDLIPKGVLDSSTKLVLLNAIHFKGTWAVQFDAADTKKELFHTDSNKGVEVDMMHLEDKFFYSEDEDIQAQVLDLPYEGDHLSMIIFLPFEKTGLKRLEERLTKKTLTSSLEKLTKQTVQVSLPKFELEVATQLKEVLKEMGMEEMFSMKADFRGIADVTGLYVSQILHKASIEVNEQGSEAAAATGEFLMFRSMPPPPTMFVADHPFIFMVLDKTEDTVLFIGKCTKGQNKTA